MKSNLVYELEAEVDISTKKLLRSSLNRKLYIVASLRYPIQMNRREEPVEYHEGCTVVN